MGASGSKSTTSGKKAGAKKTSKSKPQKIRGTVKIILVGTSASGKTTLAKQLRIITTEGDPFDREETEIYKKLIRYNLITNFGAIGTLIKRFSEEEKEAKASGKEISLETRARIKKTKGILPNTIANLAKISEYKYDADVTNNENEELFTYVKNVCQDERLMENFDYELTYIRHYTNKIESVLAVDYTPTLDDILRTRQRTTGFSDLSFIKDKVMWEIFDVGGQLAERRKWELIANSNKINAVVFCMSLADFQDTNQETGKTCLIDTLELFRRVVKESWVNGKALIIFLNKTDLFKERLEKGVIKLTTADPSYTGENTYENGISLFEKMFKDIIRDANKSLEDTTVYPTCALDTSQTKIVLDAITDNLISQRLDNNL
jgi:guanine nucleotide-binding protein G(z) subunit alpha